VPLIGHFFAKRMLSLQNVLILVLVVGLVVAGICSQGASRRQLVVQLGRPAAAWEDTPFVAPMSKLHAGSAHLNVWEAVSSRLLVSEARLGGPLLLLRGIAPLLAFVLLLVGLLSAYDTVSREIETRELDSLLSVPVSRHILGLSKAVGESSALLVTMAAGFAVALLVATRVVHLEWTGEQVARAVAFLLLLEGYTFLFVLLGMWISALARSSRQALWISAAVFIGTFSFHVLVENAMALDVSDLPTPPAVPTEVSLFFREARAQSFPPIEELPDAVATYFGELDGYSQSLWEVIGTRYRAERWWSFVSPPALLLEVSGRLLQDQYYDVRDVFYAPTNPQRPASLAASIGQSAGEIVWLLVLCLGALAANIRTLTRLEV
jgi:hypothetical protein